MSVKGARGACDGKLGDEPASEGCELNTYSSRSTGLQSETVLLSLALAEYYKVCYVVSVGCMRALAELLRA